MVRKLMVFFLVVLILAFPLPGKASTAPMKIILWIGKEEAQVGMMPYKLDAPPFLEGNRTFVPLRFISEAMGAKVDWKQDEKKVTVELEKIKIELWIGKMEALVNGAKKTLDVAPLIRNNRTFVPLRFIAEGLGAQVEWNQYEKKITITFQKEIKEGTVPKATSSAGLFDVKPTKIEPVPAWMPSDDKIREAIALGKGMTENEYIDQVIGRGFITSGGLNPQTIVSLVTPYWRIVLESMNLYSLLKMELKFEGAKEDAKYFSHSLGFMAICYGREPDFYKDYKAQLILSGGKVLDPTLVLSEMKTELIPDAPPGFRYGIIILYLFDTAQISRSEKVTFVEIRGGGEKHSAAFDLMNYP